MKKIIIALFVMAMICAFSTTAFAAVPDPENHDVLAKYNGGTTTPTVYSVDVSWGTMEFTYNVGGTKDWNPDEHTYTDSSTASWTASGNTVTVTNHSNAAVKASFAFTSLTEFTTTVQGNFDKTSFELASAVDTAKDSAPSNTSTLTVSGSVPSTQTALTKIGTVTVTIAEPSGSSGDDLQDGGYFGRE